MSEDNAKPDLASLEVLVRGAEKTFDNAEHLFFEAELLAKAGAVARALCLHQISLEECSKVDTLGAWGMSLVMGLEVDQKKVLAAFARHASKNKSNAYMLEESEAEKDAKRRGDLKGAIEAFKKSQAEFHETSNQGKNASLYVDWVDVEFVAPSERITEAMLAEIKGRNAQFLGYAHNSVKMLKRTAAAPEDVRGMFSGFVAQAEKLRDTKPDNPIEAIETWLWDFLEAEPRRRRSEDPGQ
ncbi:AbiV family abortive infection protein [Mesorhizobium sp. M0435]|uniref:AbiV family abortive infection protein n=1 Tax=Mesorhizobium sp. M0435 TaxID=2956944 RepID=UPI00333B0919